VDNVQLPLDYFVGDADDDIGFYRSEISSDVFQVQFPSVKVALGISSIVIPTFGLMVRERNRSKKRQNHILCHVVLVL
jgi:hypothetical protein